MQAGFELREITLKLHLITDLNKWAYWVVEFIGWHQTHKNFINQKTYNQDTGRYWFTHKSFRRSFIHIKRALPDMFHYLDHPQIPKSTNAIEAFFGHLKQNIAIQRGLSKEHCKNYIKWYL